MLSFILNFYESNVVLSLSNMIDSFIEKKRLPIGTTTFTNCIWLWRQNSETLISQKNLIKSSTVLGIGDGSRHRQRIQAPVMDPGTGDGFKH